MNYQSFAIGDSCIYYTLGEGLSLELSERVLGLYQQLRRSEKLKSLGVTDVVPAYTGVALYFEEPHQTQSIAEHLEDLLTGSSIEVGKGREHRIPVVYDGLDIERLSAITKLETAELIRIHTKTKYLVAMIGFLPNFPYLLGLDQRLHVPRLDSPRVAVPAGSVAIGGAQTGVYPQSSPGGWNIIGTCDPVLLRELSPGDRVSFFEASDAA